MPGGPAGPFAGPETVIASALRFGRPAAQRRSRPVAIFRYQVLGFRNSCITTTRGASTATAHTARLSRKVPPELPNSIRF